MYLKHILGNSSVKKLLVKEVLKDRIPHAQLFTGASGVGKLGLAWAFTTYLFCEKKQNNDSCGECDNCTKMAKLSHPDIHFFYPTIKTEAAEKTSKSKKNFPEFQKKLIQNPYLSLHDWEKHTKGENKKTSIRIADAATIQKIYNLKPYQGLYKVFIIWGAEKMNAETSNSLLKILEEPSINTLFILITNRPDNLIKTILSRVQVKLFSKISSDLIVNEIQKTHKEIDAKLIYKKIQDYNHDYNLIIQNLENNNTNNDLYLQFVYWIRLCFLSPNKKSRIKHKDGSEKKLVIESLINWCSEISSQDRQFQIEFIKHSLFVFRHAFLLNYSISFNEFPEKEKINFDIESFAKHVHNKNIENIFILFNQAYYYLNRYANSKILFLDLSFSLGKNLHKKN